jgi:hypothetical protein
MNTPVLEALMRAEAEGAENTAERLQELRKAG